MLTCQCRGSDEEEERDQIMRRYQDMDAECMCRFCRAPYPGRAWHCASTENVIWDSSLNH